MSQPGAWVVGLAYRASIQGSQRQCAGSIRYVHTVTGWVGTGTGKLYWQVRSAMTYAIGRTSYMPDDLSRSDRLSSA